MKRRLTRWLPLLVVIAVGYGAVTQAQPIKDWYALRNFEPDSAIAALATDTDMSDEGRRLFYVSRPELNERETFNFNCPFPERTLVLGCYSTQRIYIFNVNDPRLAGVEEVTAAHEMLHAAYERLSESERQTIDQALMHAYEQSKDQRLRETVDQYRQDDPDSVTNELHSILGTEQRTLPAVLEEHYRKYFNDRSVVVGISENYEQVFGELQDDITRLDKRIGRLRTEIADLEDALESMSAFLEQESTRLERLLNEDEVAAYNAAVPGYNSTVNEFNDTIDRYQQKVNLHNSLIDERNSIVVEQSSLVQSLDSKFSSIDKQ